MAHPISSDVSVFSPAGFRDLARRTLALTPPDDFAAHEIVHDGPSDYDLSREISGSGAPQGLLQTARPAAVLIPAFARSVVTLLMTQRTEHLSHHAGQIAFPGGKKEPSDASPLDTALREAHEEIGLDPALVEPLGYLDSYLTGTGYRIFPVIGLVDPRATLVLDPNEVADAFEVPLPFVMDPGNYKRHARTIGGEARHFYAVPFENRFIWGATAGILRTLHKRLFTP